MRRSHARVSLFMLVNVLVFVRPAAAQGTPLAPQASARTGQRSGWEVEVRGGLVPAVAPSGGRTALPPAGAALPTTGFATDSRVVPSWFFGDGSVLLNQALVNRNSPARISPLNAVLNASSVGTATGPTFGVRVSRRLTPRLTWDVSFDVGPDLRFTDQGASDVERTRATFTAAFNSLLSTGTVTNATASATAAVSDKAGREVSVTGGLRLAFGQDQATSTFVGAGAGILSHVGDAPSATLVGDYQFNRLISFGTVGFPIHETDTTTVRYALDRTVVAHLSAGFRRAVTSRSGFSGEIRLALSPNALRVRVGTSAASVVGASTGDLRIDVVQFSTTPGVATSLSGPAINSFETFTGSGLRTQVGFLFGYYFRF